jgi:ABC-type branched-subunit amino acid transport system substrate-binding protein
VPNIALSQKSGITETSPYVFKNALTNEMQVRELVRIAMEDLGLKRFAILFPNDAYGVEFSNLFWDEVLARGGTITGAQTYSNKETDFKNPIQRLTGTFFTGARAEEYKLRAKEIKDKKLAEKKSIVRNEEGTDILPPVIDFDAVFIPDNSKSLGQISAMLSYVGVKSVYLLGTNLWNSPGLAKRTGLFANSTLFVDSFSEFDSRFKSASTIKEFQAVYKELPGSFEIQGYDTAVLIRSLINKGLNTREQLNQGLTQIKDVPGALSLMSMDPSDREVMRPVFGYGLDKGEITIFQNKLKSP